MTVQSAPRGQDLVFTEGPAGKRLTWRSRCSGGCSRRMGHWTIREPGCSLSQHQGFLHPGSTGDPAAHWPSLPRRNCSENRVASHLHSSVDVESTVLSGRQTWVCILAWLLICSVALLFNLAEPGLPCVSNRVNNMTYCAL